MSIILKGIDLPKGDTAEVIIRIQPNGEVRDSHGILLDAEAIQIPKGHGRLIDADYIKALYYEFSPTEEDAPEGAMAEVTELFDMRALDEAPTILEAEEE